MDIIEGKWYDPAVVLPEDGEIVLTDRNGDKELFIYCIGDEPMWLSREHGNWIRTDFIRYWMRIPEPPSE